MASHPLNDSATPINDSNTAKLTFGSRRKYLSAKICRKCENYSSIPTLFLLLLCCWAIGYSLFGEIFGVESQIFVLVVLFVTAKIAGSLVTLVQLPPMVGMLVMGILLRNVGFLDIDDDYRRFTSILRQLALVNILLPAGLGLNAEALTKMKWMIINLSVVPVAAEIIGITVAAHYLINFPWIWGVLLGLLLAAVSPAVIIPCLFELQDMGYGVNKGIHTLVIAASTMNDVICIVLFGIVNGIIFSTETLTMQIVQGPIVLGMGLSYGIFWGIICQYLPNVHEEYLVTLRTLLLGLGCVVASLGSSALGYGAAGPLGCIVAAFVACIGWRKDGWDANNPVRKNFTLLWKFFEPISFGLIGMEVNLTILTGTTVGWAMIILIVPLLLRMAVSFASTYWSNLNVKENIFVAISWIPKATVQAALGPVALDTALQLSNAEALVYANSVVLMAVLSIIITSPIGAVLIMQLGPKFLHQTIPVNENNV